jgi:hypothetical protein
MQRPTSRRLQGCPVQSAVLRGFPTLCRRKTWRPELEPARVAEFPQPAHKARAPNTEQFTACTLRIAPNDSEPFIVLHVYLHPAERIQRRAVRPGSLSSHRRSLLIASRLWCRRIRLREGWFLGGDRFRPRVLLQSNRTRCALLARCSGENEALIVDLLDWKKF